jgi:NADP-dependent 3-hydroxy acid dehydrogenase YdfG
MHALVPSQSAVLDTNLKAAMQLSHAALPTLLASDASHRAIVRARCSCEC